MPYRTHTTLQADVEACERLAGEAYDSYERACDELAYARERLDVRYPVHGPSLDPRLYRMVTTL